MRQQLIIAVALIASACASGVADPKQPASTAEVEVTSISPSAGSAINPDTPLVAGIKYSIKNYKPNVDYYVAPVFASKKGADTRFNMLDRIGDAPRITTPEGIVTMRYGVARELASPQLDRPVRVWFYVIERTSPTTTQAIGIAGPFEFRDSERPKPQ